MKSDIEAAWCPMEPVKRHYEAHGILCTDCHLNRVMSSLWLSYNLNLRPRPRRLLRVPPGETPEPAKVADERQRLTEAGEPVPKFVLSGVRFEHKLDWEIFGPRQVIKKAPELDQTQSEEARRQRRRTVVCNFSRPVRRPVLLLEYGKLDDEMFEAWLKRRKSGTTTRLA